MVSMSYPHQSPRWKKGRGRWGGEEIDPKSLPWPSHSHTNRILKKKDGCDGQSREILLWIWQRSDGPFVEWDGRIFGRKKIWAILPGGSCRGNTFVRLLAFTSKLGLKIDNVDHARERQPIFISKFRCFIINTLYDKHGFKVKKTEVRFEMGKWKIKSKTVPLCRLMPVSPWHLLDSGEN